MLTGDKMETAICIAQSSRLVAKTQSLYQFKVVSFFFISTASLFKHMIVNISEMNIHSENDIRLDNSLTLQLSMNRQKHFST